MTQGRQGVRRLGSKIGIESPSDYELMRSRCDIPGRRPWRLPGFMALGGCREPVFSEGVERYEPVFSEGE